jgi:U3 small nucleolar RNA-associated protein 22
VKEDSADEEIYNDNSNESDSGVSGDVSITKKTTKKRKNKSKDGNKAKKTKSDEKLTAEEIKELKETEDLYHSSMFRLQIDETLKEVRLSDVQQEFVKKWLNTFKKFLKKLPSEEISGFWQSLTVVEGTKKPQMSYKPPEDAILFGSHALETNIEVKSAVDVLLIMPSEFFHKSDYVNQVFIHKRAIYLSYIAKKLTEKKTLGGNIKIINLKNDPVNPVLVLDAEEFHFSITASPPEDFFKLNRFVPVTNNIKQKNGSESVTPTPHYNFEVLYSCTIQKNQKFLEQYVRKHENVKHAIKLIKIWLHQREFDVGFHGINGFIASCYLAHLLRTKRIFPTMSCYQILRVFWNHFGNSQLDTNGISLCSEKNLPNQVKYSVVLIKTLCFVTKTPFSSYYSHPWKSFMHIMISFWSTHRAIATFSHSYLLICTKEFASNAGMRSRPSTINWSIIFNNSSSHKYRTTFSTIILRQSKLTASLLRMSFRGLEVPKTKLTSLT